MASRKRARETNDGEGTRVLRRGQGEGVRARCHRQEETSRTDTTCIPTGKGYSYGIAKDKTSAASRHCVEGMIFSVQKKLDLVEPLPKLIVLDLDKTVSAAAFCQPNCMIDGERESTNCSAFYVPIQQQ